MLAKAIVEAYQNFQPGAEPGETQGHIGPKLHMRSAVLFCTALFIALPHGLVASDAVPRLASGVTLILRFAEPAPSEVVRSLEGEVSQLLRSTGILISTRLFSELTPNEQFTNLVVVDLKGRCRVDARPPERLQPGALAYTHRSDGEILPFVDVLCDQVRNSIRPHMLGQHFRQAYQVLGRALGRVIAHELYHVLGRTCDHASKGVAQDALSGEQLIGEELQFEDEDLQRIQAGAGM